MAYHMVSTSYLYIFRRCNSLSATLIINERKICIHGCYNYIYIYIYIYILLTIQEKYRRRIQKDLYTNINILRLY